MNLPNSKKYKVEPLPNGNIHKYKVEPVTKKLRPLKGVQEAFENHEPKKVRQIKHPRHDDKAAYIAEKKPATFPVRKSFQRDMTTKERRDSSAKLDVGDSYIKMAIYDVQSSAKYINLQATCATTQVLIDVVAISSNSSKSLVVNILQSSFAIFFMIDVVCRVSTTPKLFCSSRLAQIDFFVSILDIVYVALIWFDVEDKFELITILSIVRLLRLLRFVRLKELVSVEKSFHEGMSISNVDDAAILVDETDRVALYDPDQLFSIGFLFNFRFTVVGNRSIWTQFGLFTLVSFVYGAFLCPENDDNESDLESPTCLPRINGEIGMQFVQLVAFLLGLFVDQTFSRWWDTRMRLQEVIWGISNFSLQAVTFIPGDDALSQYTKINCIRYMNLSHALLYKEVRQENHDWDDLVKDKLVTPEEEVLLRGCMVPFQLPFFWVTQLLYQAGKHKCIPYFDNMMAMFQDQISKNYDASSEIFTFLQCQIPYIYTHLMTILVKMNLFLMSLYVGTQMDAFKPGQYFWIALGLLLLAINNLVCEGLLVIHSALQDPFGDDTCDFPTLSYQDHAYMMSTAYLANERDIPFKQCEIFKQAVMQAKLKKKAWSPQG